MFVRYALVCALAAGLSRGQSSLPSDDWLMKNYHFTGPPPAGTVRPVDPVISELWRIQNTVRAILRKANLQEDYEAALAAAAQATANAQLIGALTERQQQQGERAAMTASDEAKSETSGPVYLIALKDKSIAAATSYWVDGSMLNYITLQGSHMIVRLDLVDRNLSSELNRQRKVEFHLPQ